MNELLDTLEFNQVVIFVKSVARAIELDKLLDMSNDDVGLSTASLPNTV